MKKNLSQKSKIKSDKAFFKKNAFSKEVFDNDKMEKFTKKFFGKTAKRAYIALLLLVGVVSVSSYMRNRAEIAEISKSAFDENVWQEAVNESGIEEPVIAVSSNVLPSDADSKIDKEEESNTEKENVAFESEENTPTEAMDIEVISLLKEEESTGFIRPSNGKIINEFSGDELVYQSSTEDWRTHNGLDFAATEGEQVLAVADGVVKRVEKDEMWGIVIEIEHKDGIISRYTGLQSLDFINEGKAVKKGDIVGGVGKAGILEAEGDTHLHFEILKNGDYENPNFYFIK